MEGQMDKSYINKPPVHVTKMSIVSITGKVLSVEAGQSTFRPEQTISRIKAMPLQSGTISL